MKKLFTGIAAAALTLSLCATPALAACHGHGHGCSGAYKSSNCNYYKTSCQHVDKNKDGICDYCGSNSCGKGYGYVDANGDGICDYYTTGASKGCKGHGRRGC